jgi:pullulanase/glycogen debranching enzyme
MPSTGAASSVTRRYSQYYRGLVALRKATPEFRLARAADIRRQLAFLPVSQAGVVAFLVAGEQRTMLVIHNANRSPVQVEIPEGRWQVLVDDRQAGPKVLRTVNGGSSARSAHLFHGAAWVVSGRANNSSRFMVRLLDFISGIPL